MAEQACLGAASPVYQLTINAPFHFPIKINFQSAAANNFCDLGCMCLIVWLLVVDGVRLLAVAAMGSAACELLPASD